METENKDLVVYPAIFAYEPGQEISVYFPDLEVATSGVDDKDALFSAQECLGFAIYGREEDGEPIPEPTNLQDVSIAENERAVLVDAFMPAIRQAQDNRSVKKTVTIPAWLDARARERDVNFSQTLQQALCQQLGATASR